MNKLQVLILMILLTTEQIAISTPTQSQEKKAGRVARQVKLQAKKNLKLQNTAYHEAGHAVSNTYNYNGHIIKRVTIQPSKNFFGKIERHATYLVDRNTQELKNETMISLAGGVGEQIFKSENMLSNKKDILRFFSNHHYSNDIESAKKSARSIIMQTSPTLDEEQINLKIDAMITKLYKQSYKFLTQHKDGVAKVAHELLENQELSGDEIYNLLDVPKPLMDFEEGPLPEKYKNDYISRNISAEYIESLHNKNTIDLRRTTIENLGSGFTIKKEYYFNGSIAKIIQTNSDKTRVETSIDPDKKHSRNYYDAHNNITKIIACNPDKSIISTKYFDTNGNEIHDHE